MTIMILCTPPRISSPIGSIIKIGWMISAVTAPRPPATYEVMPKNKQLVGSYLVHAPRPGPAPPLESWLGHGPYHLTVRTKLDLSD